MSEALLRRYWRAQDPYDPDELAACRHPRWSSEWPQTGERVPNNDADVKIHSTYPGYPKHEQGHSATDESEAWVMSPSFTPIRVTTGGEVAIAEGRLDYPDIGVHHIAVLIELKDGLIWRETAYFAQRFAPRDWRAHLADALPHGTPPPPGKA